MANSNRKVKNQARCSKAVVPIPFKNVSVQQWAIIIGLLTNALIVESVVINRNKTVQVILGGDFGKHPGGFEAEDLVNESLGLFEAIEHSVLDEQRHRSPKAKR